MTNGDLERSFEKVLWEAGSGFHDSRLFRMRMTMASRELAIVLHFSNDTPEKPIGDVYLASFRFNNVTEFRLESKNRTFPTEMLIDHFEATSIPGEESGCEFTLTGTYGWELIWRASAFSFRKSPTPMRCEGGGGGYDLKITRNTSKQAQNP